MYNAWSRHHIGLLLRRTSSPSFLPSSTLTSDFFQRYCWHIHLPSSRQVSIFRVRLMSTNPTHPRHWHTWPSGSSTQFPTSLPSISGVTHLNISSRLSFDFPPFLSLKSHPFSTSTQSAGPPVYVLVRVSLTMSSSDLRHEA